MQPKSLCSEKSMLGITCFVVEKGPGQTFWVLENGSFQLVLPPGIHPEKTMFMLLFSSGCSATMAIADVVTVRGQTVDWSHSTAGSGDAHQSRVSASFAGEQRSKEMFKYCAHSSTQISQQIPLE